MSLNPYGKFWSSVQKFSTAIVLCARAYEISLRISANFFSIEQYCTSTFYLIRSEMPSQIQSKNVDFCCAIFSCVCLHSERYKNYTSKGASRLFYITLRERLVPNIAFLSDVFLIEQLMAAYSIFKFQNMNIQGYFTQKLRGFRLGNKKN